MYEINPYAGPMLLGVALILLVGGIFVPYWIECIKDWKKRKRN